ncbi:MAG: DUF4837 family protein [Bacteroidota bacterium]
MNRPAYFLLLSMIAMLILQLPGCDSTGAQGGKKGRILPNVTGGAGEVLVVMDKFNWENAAGEALRNVLMKEVPALPQSEPSFDISQTTAASFDGFFQFHRTIVLTAINPSLKEPVIGFREDVWARPQIVVDLQAASSQQLIELIDANQDKILNLLLQYDRKRLMSVYKSSSDPALQETILKDHQVKVVFPRGYNLDLSNKEYSSVSIETPDYSQVVQIYEYPAESEEALSTENLMAMRDKITEKYVRGPDDSSYMVIAGILPPIVYDLKINQRNVVEMRGLWELRGGFMGGPFVSHAFYDAARKRVVVIDGYVFYPNEKKRIRLRQVEAVVYSMEPV